MKSVIDSPGYPRSTMMQAGLCCWINVFNASSERAGFTDSPRAWAVPVMRLVKIMSSQSNKPSGVGGEGTDMDTLLVQGSNRLGTAFPGTDANAVLQRQDKDLAVTDAAFGTGTARFHDRVHRRLDEILIDGNL